MADGTLQPSKGLARVAPGKPTIVDYQTRDITATRMQLFLYLTLIKKNISVFTFKDTYKVQKMQSSA